MLVSKGPKFAPGVGLDAPIPDDWPGGGHTIRPGLTLKRWPSVYLTDRVKRIARLHDVHRRGIPVRTDGAVHWPAPLVRAFLALDEERGLARGE
jgi:hypothetical protein